MSEESYHKFFKLTVIVSSSSHPEHFNFYVYPAIVVSNCLSRWLHMTILSFGKHIFMVHVKSECEKGRRKLFAFMAFEKTFSRRAKRRSLSKTPFLYEFVEHTSNLLPFGLNSKIMRINSGHMLSRSLHYTQNLCTWPEHVLSPNLLRILAHKSLFVNTSLRRKKATW